MFNNILNISFLVGHLDNCTPHPRLKEIAKNKDFVIYNSYFHFKESTHK